jgi:hypothetical protein
VARFRQSLGLSLGLGSEHHWFRPDLDASALSKVSIDVGYCEVQSGPVGNLSLWERLTRGFDSGSDFVLFGLVVGVAMLFCGYLVFDGFYHRHKWRRLQRQCREAGEALREDCVEQAVVVPEDGFEPPTKGL